MADNPNSLLDTLDTAIELAEDALEYVPPYFREKWSMNEQLSAIKAARKALDNDDA